MRFRRFVPVLIPAALLTAAVAAGALAQGWTDRFESETARTAAPAADPDPPPPAARPSPAGPTPDPRQAAAPAPRGPAGPPGPCVAPPGAPTPTVRFATRLGEIVHHNTQTRAGLKAIQTKSGKRAGGVGPGWQPIGLTLTEIKLRTRINVSAQPMAGGQVCARLASVEAEMGMEKIDVHVTNGYRPGSCQYHAVMDHEMRHVGVFRDAVTRHSPLVRVRLDQLARTLEPVVAGSAKEAAGKLRARIERDLESMFRDMNRDIERRNQALDTRESYEREQKRCPSW